MKNHFLKYTGIVLLVAITAISCRKDAFEGDETLESGTTHFKVLEGREIKLFFTPFTETKAKVHLFSIRRDAASSADLQQSATIKIEQNAGIITKYNTDHGDSFEELPSSVYTFGGDAGYVKTATGYNVSFAPGVFSQNFKLNINGSNWVDLSKKYALAFRVTDWGGIKKTVATSDTIMVLLSIKNKYDGVYDVSGSMVDVVSPTLSHFSIFVNSAANTFTTPPYQLELRTISPTKCAAYDNYFFGGYFTPITSGTTYSNYGSFSAIFEFDPATDKVIGVTNYYGQPASNTRSARLDPTGTVNAYDASTKTMTVKYNMIQPSSVPTAPSVRTTWNEVWKYLKERQ
ncbi:DUF1735 domain-containing protein [Pedobacter sp. BMA]|uniref:DUF1735 domain-containing protein n=1 Tax=Pedobacter sp. BMA TaxID=1663685 RepID=UPI00064946D7|nr:DUF1735 domain-containing protein [Pedobacter sp. BMA]KLT64683.1 hypothetical protein AB669_13060 [Pedobacter sp. BMA]